MYIFSRGLVGKSILLQEKEYYKSFLNSIHCGVSKTQQKWFYDENRDNIDDEIRRN